MLRDERSLPRYHLYCLRQLYVAGSILQHSA